jgi:class 3 adenylate cyclase
MNGPAALAGAPREGLVAEFRDVILKMRPRADAELIERACDVAARCHEGQLRRSGDPYITHPVAVATILAGLDDIAELDDQTLCAAVLHDTVEDTSYTMAALRREFGAGTAAMVAEVTALDRLGRRPGRNPAQVLTTITAADTRVVAVKLADRLHNMQTMQCMPQATQLRKAREVLDTFLPVAQQLSMHTVRSELQALAFATLIRNQPLRRPRSRVIVALDIENSTSRSDAVKAELRTMLYELFDAALRSAGIGARRRGRFTDRGDGLLALLDPADQARLVNLVLPAFGQLLASYNANLPQPGRPDRQLRIRVVIHAGNVHDDDNGYFGEALDAAFRLLDAPPVKAALRETQGPLLLVGSASLYDSSASNGPDRAGYPASRNVITAKVAGHQYQGWIHVPAETTYRGLCKTRLLMHPRVLLPDSY